ncbi:uncharacterized protein ACWYII_017115 [Salvelinus alpinus]
MQETVRGEHQESQKKIQDRDKEIQELRQVVDSLKRSALAAVEDSERSFTELIRSIERRRSEVKELIRAQEKAEVSRAEGHLEQGVAELRRSDAELRRSDAELLRRRNAELLRRRDAELLRRRDAELLRRRDAELLRRRDAELK